jgi:hypothetical protein
VNQFLNLKGGLHPLDPLIWKLYLSLKIGQYWEYLEPYSGLSGSMKKSNLINSVFPVSFPSTIFISSTLETKGMGGFLFTGGGKGTGDYETHLLTWFRLIWINN